MTFRLSKSSTEAFREHFPCSLFSILGDFNTRTCGFVAAFQFSNLEIDVLAFPFPNKNNRKATLCCYFEKETLTRGNCHLCDKESREEQKQTPKLTCFMSRDEWKLYYSSLTTFVFLSENDTHLDQNYTREREKREPKDQQGKASEVVTVDHIKGKNLRISLSISSPYNFDEDFYKTWNWHESKGFFIVSFSEEM